VDDWQDKLRFTKLPVSFINQTWVSTYRRCAKKSLLQTQFERQDGNFYMFGGSAFHVALEHAVKSPDRNHWLAMSNDESYWDDVFGEVFEFNARDTYVDVDFDRFRYNLVRKDLLDGFNIGQLIFFALQFLDAAGFEILHCELPIRLDIPDGIPYTGTVDIVLNHRDVGMVIADTKTSGIWQKYFRSASITKQSYSETQVANHLQLTHYGWMGWRAGLWSPEDIKKHMIFTPANLTKYSRGSKKGQMRGPPFHWGEPNPRNIYRYEGDLVTWLTMAEAGMFPRMYPSMFGKLDCDKCPFHEHCYSDKSSEAVPSYLKGV